jgi:ATP-dependent HslUV protease subunit HslV
MTTIAYRDGILAADGLATRGDNIVERNCKKLIRMNDGGVVGCCGHIGRLLQFIEWLEDKSKPMPSLAMDDGQTSTIIVLNGEGLTEYQNVGFSKVDDLYTAWGSGSAAAMAALAMGADAETAVRIASEVDVWTGGQVMTMAYERPAA